MKMMDSMPVRGDSGYGRRSETDYSNAQVRSKAIELKQKLERILCNRGYKLLNTESDCTICFSYPAKKANVSIRLAGPMKFFLETSRFYTRTASVKSFVHKGSIDDVEAALMEIIEDGHPSVVQDAATPKSRGEGNPQRV